MRSSIFGYRAFSCNKANSSSILQSISINEHKTPHNIFSHCRIDYNREPEIKTDCNSQFRPNKLTFNSFHINRIRLSFDINRRKTKEPHIKRHSLHRGKILSKNNSFCINKNTQLFSEYATVSNHKRQFDSFSKIEFPVKLLRQKPYTAMRHNRFINVYESKKPVEEICRPSILHVDCVKPVIHSLYRKSMDVDSTEDYKGQIMQSNINHNTTESNIDIHDVGEYDEEYKAQDNYETYFPNIDDNNSRRKLIMLKVKK